MKTMTMLFLAGSLMATAAAETPAAELYPTGYAGICPGAPQIPGCNLFTPEQSVYLLMLHAAIPSTTHFGYTLRYVLEGHDGVRVAQGLAVRADNGGDVTVVFLPLGGKVVTWEATVEELVRNVAHAGRER